MTVHRPPVCTTGKPVFNLTLSSWFGSTGKLILHTYCKSMLWSIDNCQNRVTADQYHLTVSRAQVSTHQGWAFFEVIRSQVTSFQMIAGASLFFLIHMKSGANRLLMKYVAFMRRTIKILNSNWPRIRKFRQLLQAGKTFAFNFSPWPRVGHALRPNFMLWLVKIWQVSSCAKFMQHLESCLLWQLKLTEFCVNL